MRGFESRRFQRNTFGTVLLLAQGEDVLHPIVIGRSAGHDPAQGIALPKRAVSRPVEYGFENGLVCFLVHSVAPVTRPFPRTVDRAESPPTFSQYQAAPTPTQDSIYPAAAPGQDQTSAAQGNSVSLPVDLGGL